MSQCYNAAGNPDPTQYVNASGACVHAGGRRKARGTTRKTRVNRRNAARRDARSTRRSTRRNARSNRRNTRRQNYYAPY